MAGIGERVMMIGALVFGGTLIYVGMLYLFGIRLHQMRSHGVDAGH